MELFSKGWKALIELSKFSTLVGFCQISANVAKLRNVRCFLLYFEFSLMMGGIVCFYLWLTVIQLVWCPFVKWGVSINLLIYCFYSGSEDGKIHVWNAESGMKVALLDGKHTGPITCLQFNPKFMTFASACSNMVSARSGVGLGRSLLNNWPFIFPKGILVKRLVRL